MMREKSVGFGMAAVGLAVQGSMLYMVAVIVGNNQKRCRAGATV